MPAILKDEEEARRWLFGPDPFALLSPVGEDVLSHHPVSTAVGNCHAESPSLILPVQLDKPRTGPLDRFFAPLHPKSSPPPAATSKRQRGEDNDDEHDRDAILVDAEPSELPTPVKKQR
ncbi:MAG: hypothetical protein Q8P67_16075, partial [archaeon]|nr:hypothetical protein [archaeon]